MGTCGLPRLHPPEASPACTHTSFPDLDHVFFHLKVSMTRRSIKAAMP